MAIDDDTAAIRRFLIEHFSDTDLRALCLDYFRDVYEDFTAGMGERQMVHNLIEHCLNHGRLSDLLAALERERPQLYAQHFTHQAEPLPERPAQVYTPIVKAPAKPAKEEPKARSQPEGETPDAPVKVEEDVFVHPKTGKEMVRIPAGEFLYGDNKEKVYLDEYWIDRTPVTHAEYKRFLDANPNYSVPFEDKNWARPYNWDQKRRTYPADKADHPVVLVSWHDAKAYADWAELRLPTEQEWEKAARGSDGSQYPWGNGWRDDHCNSREAGIEGTTPVGRFSPLGDSPYGCVDMAGNVWEWTDSRYDEAEGWRVVRGGSWLYGRNFARAAYRPHYHPDYRFDLCGFRVVRRPPSDGH